MDLTDFTPAGKAPPRQPAPNPPLTPYQRWQAHVAACLGRERLRELEEEEMLWDVRVE